MKKRNSERKRNENVMKNKGVKWKNDHRRKAKWRYNDNKIIM